MPKGICALCHQSRELQCSHVIPNAFFRRIKQRNFGRLVAIDDSANTPVQYSIDSWSENLLCSECESHLSTYEKYAVEILRGTQKTAFHLHRDGLTFRGVSYEKLKLFFTSLIWRAAVSTIAPFAKVTLPDPLKEEARASLLSKNPLSPKKLGCRISQLFDPTPSSKGGFSDSNIKQLIISPIPRIHGRYVSFLFVMEGYLLEFFVPSIPLRESSQHGVLRNTKILYVPKKNIFEVKELVKFMVAGHRKADLGMVTFQS